LSRIIVGDAATRSPPPHVLSRRRSCCAGRRSRARLPTALGVQKFAYGPIPTDLSETDRAYRAAEDLYATTPGLPPELVAVVATLFLGAATYWGPDWLLAPLGLETNTRPGKATELALARLRCALTGEAPKTRDSDEASSDNMMATSAPGAAAALDDGSNDDAAHAADGVAVASNHNDEERRRRQPPGVVAPPPVGGRRRPSAASDKAGGASSLQSAAAKFVAEREAGFQAEAPVGVAAAAWLAHWGFGALTYVALVRALDDDGAFVASLACCFAIAGAVYEIGRPKTPTRQEADAAASLREAFADFAERRLERVEEFQASTHRTEIVKAFRRSVGRYRTAEGSGVNDREIFRMARQWHRGQVTSAGFFKGLSLKPEADVF